MLENPGHVIRLCETPPPGWRGEKKHNKTMHAAGNKNPLESYSHTHINAKSVTQSRLALQLRHTAIHKLKIKQDLQVIKILQRGSDVGLLITRS